MCVCNATICMTNCCVSSQTIIKDETEILVFQCAPPVENFHIPVPQMPRPHDLTCTLEASQVGRSRIRILTDTLPFSGNG